MGRFDDLIPAKPTAAPAPVRKRLFDDLIPTRSNLPSVDRGQPTADEPDYSMSGFNVVSADDAGTTWEDASGAKFTQPRRSKPATVPIMARGVTNLRPEAEARPFADYEAPRTMDRGSGVETPYGFQPDTRDPIPDEPTGEWFLRGVDRGALGVKQTGHALKLADIYRRKRLVEEGIPPQWQHYRPELVTNRISDEEKQPYLAQYDAEADQVIKDFLATSAERGKIPGHPLMQQMVEAGNATGLKGFVDTFYDAPWKDRLGAISQLTAEQAPIILSALAIGALSAGAGAPAAVGGALAAGGSSAAMTLGPNVEAGLRDPLTGALPDADTARKRLPDAAAKAVRRTAAQSVVDAVTGGFTPAKFGGAIPTVTGQAGIQAAGGGIGEAAAMAADGKSAKEIAASRGELMLESVAELIGAPAEYLGAAVEARREAKELPKTPPPANPPLIPPSGIPEIDAGVAAAEAALDAAKANQPAPAPAAAPPDAPQPTAPPAGLRAVLVRPRPTAAPDTAQQDAAEVAALEAEMRSQGLLGEPQQAAAAPVTSRPRAPEESQQDRASRLFSENYELVVNSPNLADVPSRDIERASAYASRAMQTEARRGWNGGEVNKPLIDSLDREVGFFTDELRRRGRIGQAAPTADFAAVAAAQGMTPEQHAAASATTADIVPQPAADDGKVTVGPSQIAGDGVIAARPLAEGESVTVFEGDNRTPAGRYVNHADQPNTAFRRGDDGRTEAVATQPIPAGGEVTVDYLADPRLQPGAQTAAATDRRAQTRTPDAPIDPTDRRRADYEQRLTDLRTQGLSDEQIASVRKKLPLDVPRDRVTGFYRSEELDGTLDAGIAASEQAPATYAEVDFANLGGLNSAVGGIENANVHLTAITDILKQELDPLGATIIRKGGDEFGVIAQAPVADVNAALARARTRATEYAAANGLSQIEHQKGGAPGIGLHYAAVEIKPNRERKTILAAADTQVEARKKGAPYEETSDGQRSEVEAAGAGRGQRGQTDAATATENQGVGEGTAGAGREATRGAGQGQAAQAAVVQAEGGGSAPSRGRDDGIGRTRDGAGLDAPTQAGRGAETAAGTVPGTAASPPTKDTAASPVARPATVTINATRDNTRRLADLEIEVEAEVGGKTRKAKMPAGPLLQRAMQRVRILNQIMECVSR